jgi:hypothetical protein
MKDKEKIELIKENWDKYKEFLQKKYPAKDGEEWNFSCEYHQNIDNILRKQERTK